MRKYRQKRGKKCKKLQETRKNEMALSKNWQKHTGFEHVFSYPLAQMSALRPAVDRELFSLHHRILWRDNILNRTGKGRTGRETGWREKETAAGNGGGDREK